jgi:hypothetical protein
MQPYFDEGQIDLAEDQQSQSIKKTMVRSSFRRGAGPIRLYALCVSCVPTKYANKFAEAAELHVNHMIWIECTLNTIMDMVCKQAGAPVSFVNLCMNWDDTRG